MHYRVDTTPHENADWGVSLSPGLLWNYVISVRLAEQLMGDGQKRVEDVEAPMLRYKVRA